MHSDDYNEAALTYALAIGPGHNLPPKSIFDTINDLHTEATAWCDGTAIETDEQALELGRLLDMLAEARKACEAERKEKAKPFDDGKNAVQAEYVPFIKKAELAIDAAKAARDRYLRQKQAAIDEAARKAREEAEALKRAADDEIRRTRGNLEEREAAERKLEEAKAAEYKAIALAKATPPNVGGRKTVSDKWRPVLVDGAKAANHYWGVRRKEIEDILLKLAFADTRAGKREIPGFDVIKEN